MTDQDCWQIVDSARTDARGRVHLQADLIAKHLAARGEPDIVAFKMWLSKRMREANRPAVFIAVQWIDSANGLPDVSGDGWEYHRAWLVGLGQRDFSNALTDPDTLADHFTTFEDFLAGEAIELAAHRAFYLHTG